MLRSSSKGLTMIRRRPPSVRLLLQYVVLPSATTSEGELTCDWTAKCSYQSSLSHHGLQPWEHGRLLQVFVYLGQRSAPRHDISTVCPLSRRPSSMYACDLPSSFPTIFKAFSPLHVRSHLKSHSDNHDRLSFLTDRIFATWVGGPRLLIDVHIWLPGSQDASSGNPNSVTSLMSSLTPSRLRQGSSAANNAKMCSRLAVSNRHRHPTPCLG
ncbi:hypothetical protein V8C44DRAFT_80179 [Trichoderma aethiopicum]